MERHHLHTVHIYKDILLQSQNQYPIPTQNLIPIIRSPNPLDPIIPSPGSKATGGDPPRPPAWMYNYMHYISLSLSFSVYIFIICIYSAPRWRFLQFYGQIESQSESDSEEPPDEASNRQLTPSDGNFLPSSFEI